MQNQALSRFLPALAAFACLIPQAMGQQAANANAEVVPSLKGLVFLTGSDPFEKSGVNTAGISTSHVAMLDNDDFRERISDKLEHPLTFAGLHDITSAVIAYFRQQNHPLVDALAPEQNVESGVIQIVVTEYKVGEVKAEGNRWFSDRIVTGPLSLQHGDYVNSAMLLNQLDALNNNPFRQVNLVYQPSAEAGYTDLVLQTHDRFPVRVYTGFDNSGTPATTRSRWEMGATWGNALWNDQQISYNFSASDDLFSGRPALPGTPSGASFVGQSLTWTVPVFGRDSVSLNGGYQRAIPNIGQDFGMLGKSAEAGIRFNHSLRRTSRFIQGLQVGYDFKSTNNNLAFGGTQVSRTAAQIDEFSLGYLGSLTDRWGSTSFSSALFYSPGDLSGDNTSAAFQPGNGQTGREFAAAHYVYWRSDVTRLTKLPGSATYALRMLGQTSTSNLLYTEQLAGGGSEILRGYDPNSVLGDQGIIFSNELRSPVFHTKSEMNFGQLQVLGFWDYGHLDSVHKVDGAVNQFTASSVGVGVRYSLRSNVTAHFDYGWQLHHLPTADGRDQLANVSLIVAY